MKGLVEKFEPGGEEFFVTKPLPRPLCCMYYVYILQWKRNNNFYVGYTDNLERRLKQHQKQDNFKLIYYEAYQSEKAARQREKRLKYYGSAWRALKKRITA